MIDYLIYFICLLFLVVLLSTNKTDNFDAMGLVYNVPPNWFIKQEYNASDWLVNNYIDTIQPSCLSYDKAAKYGGLENINYLASATRFWRF